MKKSKKEPEKLKEYKTLEEGIKHYKKLASEFELMKSVVDEETIIEYNKNHDEEIHGDK